MIRRRGFLVGLLALVQVFLLTFASLAAAERWVSLPLNDDGHYAILVMGSDMGPPRADSVLQGRADAIHLVVLDEAREHVSILSFPRDSYVPVRGLGTTKINAMLTRGPENAVGTMEDVTGITIDDWMVSGFDAVITGIDEFGGVHVDVEQRLFDSKANTDLQPGYQRLTGWKALGYSRDRHSRGNGDIGRSTGQAKVLMGLHQELLDRSSSPAELMDFAGIMRRHVATSLPPDRMIRLGAIAMRLDPANVAQVTMPGNVGTAGAASIYRLSGSAYDLFADVRDDGRLSSLDDGDGG